MSLINISGLAPDNTGRRIRCNQFGDLLAATADFLPNGSVLLGSAQATALQADSVPLATADTANKRPGWYYINEEATNKINWYYYSDAANNNDRTYAQLAGLTCTMAIDGEYPPYFGVYTKPKAPLNPAHPWYDKLVVYQNQDADLNLFAGQKCLMYFAATAQDFPRNPSQLREINCPIVVSASEIPAPGDEILFITLQSDSSWEPDSFSGVVSQVGFKFVENIVEYELRAEISSGGTGSDVNITNSFIDTHATPYVGGNPVSGTNELPVIFEGQGLLALEATLIEVRNEISGGVDTQSTIYYNGNPVDSGTNAFPVIIAGSSSVEISASNGDPLTATGTALDVANPSLTAMTFDKGTDLQVKVVSQPIPIITIGTGNSAAVCQIVDSTNIPFTNTVGGALDVAVVNFKLSTENNLAVELQTATGPVGAGNPLITQNEPPALTTLAWTLANFSNGGNPDSVSPTIPSGSLSLITIFGKDTNSTGMSSPYLSYQYCLTDSATPGDWIDTLPYISLPNGGSFYDTREPNVPFLRLKINGFIAPPGPVVDTLVLNVCYK
jgi:hypothetical protein